MVNHGRMGLREVAHDFAPGLEDVELQDDVVNPVILVQLGARRAAYPGTHVAQVPVGGDDHTFVANLVWGLTPFLGATEKHFLVWVLCEDATANAICFVLLSPKQDRLVQIFQTTNDFLNFPCEVD